MNYVTMCPLHGESFSKECPECSGQPDALVELVAALRPFAEFHDGGNAWKETAWPHKELAAPVLHDYRTGREITLGDFRRAAAAFVKATHGKDETP